ncbi:hypothetical protein HMI55_005803, partial [Coelomomyces lativittatus]
MMSTSQHPDNTGNVEGALEAMALHDDRAPVSESNFDSKNNAEPHHVGAYVPPARLRSDTNNPSSYPYQPEDASCQSHQYSGNPSYGMNRQPTSNPRYQGNHRSYSNTNSFYNDNQNYRHHPSGGNHWVPNQNP